MNQRVMFFSNGGADIREVQLYLNPETEHYLDWFHITMRLTVMVNMPRGWIPRGKSVKKSSSLWKALNGLLLSEAAPPSCRHSPHTKSNLAHGKIGISISAIFHRLSTHNVA